MVLDFSANDRRTNSNFTRDTSRTVLSAVRRVSVNGIVVQATLDKYFCEIYHCDKRIHIKVSQSTRLKYTILYLPISTFL